MLVAVHGTDRTRRRRSAALPWFGGTFRTQVFFGFLLTSLITLTLGFCGWLGIADTARSVSRSFERPAPAVTAARTAQLTFARLNAERLRDLLPATPAVPGQRRDQEALAASFGTALKSLSDRALSGPTAAAARAVQQDFARWSDLRRSAHTAAEMDAQSLALEGKLDQLVTSAFQDATREKGIAAGQVSDAELLSWAEMSGAALLSLLLTSIMVRRITQPLSDAVDLAVRITGGDLSVPIPQAVQGEAGTLLRSMRVMQDGIRRMMEQERLQRRSAQMRLADALEGANEAVALVDAESRIVLANSQVMAFFPAAAGHLREGASFLDLLSFVEGARAKAPDGPTARAGTIANPLPTEILPDRAANGDDTGGSLQQFLRLAVGEVQLTDGRWLRVSRNPTRDGGFFVLWSDITAIKDREAKLGIAKREAEMANAAKNRFLATVGHELRTPLNAIIGFSEIMEAEAFGPLGSSNYKDFVAHILTGGRQLLEAINGMLDLARSDAGTLSISPDIVDLRRLLKECAQMVEERCRLASLDLSLELSEPLQVWGDPTRLRQTFLNLLSNAVKFTPAGGCVGLAACRLDDGWVEVRVVDTGIGMRPQDIPLAIAPFHQIDGELSRNFEGTGLGLPLAKALIDLHGGSLSLESEQGIGTTVTVRLRANDHLEGGAPHEDPAQG